MSNCVYAYDEGPVAEFYRSEVRRARKEYRCDECGDPIEPGDLHEHAVGKWDGEIMSFRTCARCCNVRRDYFDSVAHGCMVDDWEAEHGFDYRDGIPADFAPCKSALPSEEGES